MPAYDQKAYLFRIISNNDNMTFQSLGEIIEELRRNNDLSKIHTFVSPDLEMSEIADRFASIENGKAILFNENGTDFPVLMNLFGGEKRTNSLLKIHGADSYDSKTEDLFRLMEEKPKIGLGLLRKLKPVKSIFPKRKRRKGACQKIIHRNPDLGILPVLKSWPHDGGPFLTLPLVHTIDPDTGEQNTGMYRMQIFDSKTTGMHWHRHKGGAEHFRAWQKKGKRMPVTVTLGGDPILTYTASAPLPPGISEYMLAGFLKGDKVKLVKSTTNNIWIPECSDIVIEGYIDTSEPLRNEGPFGDHTGYYSLPDDYPVFHVTCITHRKDAVFPATVVGPPPKEDRFLGKATEEIFLPLIQKTMGPEILDMVLPEEGGFHNLALVKIKKDYPGQAIKIMHALWGAGQMMFSKIIMVFDENTDIRNKASVLKAISENVRPVYDIHMSKGPYDVLDHAAREFSFGGKAGIDATKKHKEELKDSGDKKSESADLNPMFSKNFGKNLHVIYSTTPFGEYGKMFTDFSTGHDKYVEGIFVITDQDTQGLSEPLLLWYILSVLDPERDFSLIRNSSPNGVLIINGARRGKKAVPGKKWPAVAVMSQEIIDKVSENWESYDIGPLIPSPSEKVAEFRRESHLD